MLTNTTPFAVDTAPEGVSPQVPSNVQKFFDGLVVAEGGVDTLRSFLDRCVSNDCSSQYVRDLAYVGQQLRNGFTSINPTGQAAIDEYFVRLSALLALVEGSLSDAGL